MDRNLENTNLVRVIKQNIKQYRLDLSGYSVLLPILDKSPALVALLASMAGAKEVFSVSKNINLAKELNRYKGEFKLNTSFYSIERETQQILQGLDIVLKGEGTPVIDDTFAASLKKQCIVSLLPSNLDFSKVNGINLDACKKQGISILTLDPNDQNIMLFKHIVSIIIKRLSACDVDVFRSNVILAGSGGFIEKILTPLKSTGMRILAANTDKPEDQEYVLKHLDDADALILADYPSKQKPVVGNNGFIRIVDLVDMSPDIKVIHLAGKVEVNPLLLGGIHLTPDNVVQNSLNLNINELGLRAMVEIVTGSLKIAESLIKSRNRTVLSSDSIVSFNIVNSESPMITGKVTF